MALNNMIKSKGFTMLELLMVIVVVGLLASLAVPQYQGFVEKTRMAEALNAISMIRSAQMTYFLEHGGFVFLDGGDEWELESVGLKNPNSGNNYWTYHTFAVVANGVGTITIVATRTSKGGNTYEGQQLVYIGAADGNGNYNSSSYSFAPKTS